MREYRPREMEDTSDPEGEEAAALWVRENGGPPGAWRLLKAIAVECENDSQRAIADSEAALARMQAAQRAVRDARASIKTLSVAARDAERAYFDALDAVTDARLRRFP